MLHMIYPQNRKIPESVAIIWAHDVLVNQAYKALPEDEKTNEDAISVLGQSIPNPSLQEAIFVLQDAGVATFKERK